MKTESVRYDADGLQMIGHFAYDENDSKKRPAVLVFPEAFGLGDHAKTRAERIAAELGYVAMACDLHGERRSSVKSNRSWLCCNLCAPRPLRSAPVPSML